MNGFTIHIIFKYNLHIHFPVVHVYRFIDDNVIFDGYSGEGHNFSTVPINSTHMCDTIPH